MAKAKIDLVLEELGGIKKELGGLRGLKEDVSGLKQDVSGLKQDVSGLKQDVGGLKQDVSGLKQDVGGLKQDVGELKQDVSGLKQDVGGIKQEIGGIKGKVDLLEQGQQRNYDLIQKNGIKIEQVGSDVKAVAEGHQVIRSEMRQMEGRLTENIEQNRSAIKFVADRLEWHIQQPAHA